MARQRDGNTGGRKATGPRKVNRELAGGERHRDPDRLEMGGKRLHADATRGQPLGADTDGDLDGDLERQPRR